MLNMLLIVLLTNLSSSAELSLLMTNTVISPGFIYWRISISASVRLSALSTTIIFVL